MRQHALKASIPPDFVFNASAALCHRPAYLSLIAQVCSGDKGPRSILCELSADQGGRKETGGRDRLRGSLRQGTDLPVSSDLLPGREPGMTRRPTGDSAPFSHVPMTRTRARPPVEDNSAKRHGFQRYYKGTSCQRAHTHVIRRAGSTPPKQKTPSPLLPLPAGATASFEPDPWVWAV